MQPCSLASLPEPEDRALAKHRAILWLLGNMLGYSLQGRRHVTLIDYFDFVKRCRWKGQYTQPLPDLRKGCVPRNFKHVELCVRRNFPKFNSVQFNEDEGKLRHKHHECSMYFFKALGLCSYAVYVFTHPIRVLH